MKIRIDKGLDLFGGGPCVMALRLTRQADRIIARRIEPDHARAHDKTHAVASSLVTIPRRGADIFTKVPQTIFQRISIALFE